MMKRTSLILSFFLCLGFLPGQNPSSKPASQPSRAGKKAKKPTVKPIGKPTVKPTVKPTGKNAGKQGEKKIKKTTTTQPASLKAKRPNKAGGKPKANPGVKPSSKTSQKVEVKVDGKLVDPGMKKVPIPEGASEGDIRAIRGANAMLSAEKKLPKILKKMKIKGGMPFLPFDKIDAWPYEDGFKGMPKDLKKWDKKRVVMAGFMFPIDEVEDIHEFFLVKSLWSCCYGTPPDVNGLVKVVIKKKKGIPYYYDPILIIGTFHLKKVLDEDFCVAIYEMDAEVVKVLDL